MVVWWLRSSRWRVSLLTTPPPPTIPGFLFPVIFVYFVLFCFELFVLFCYVLFVLFCVLCFVVVIDVVVLSLFFFFFPPCGHKKPKKTRSEDSHTNFT